MHQLFLNAPSARSTIVIDSGLLANTSQLCDQFRSFHCQKIVVVSNATVMLHHGKDFLASLASHNITPLVCLIEDGEQHKNWHSLMHIYNFLLENRCARDTLMVAFGGGVVGDVAGFAAATYQRGIALMQIPTTLLAQVDSSIGGKTAINHPLGKNMIGAFYQPSVVLIDTDLLQSLPQRELQAGFAEVVKYALIRDSNFFSWLANNSQGLLHRDSALLIYAITTSCQHKMTIVEADEREIGQRALLNLGHTFGHAIEKFTGFDTWLHGEAVAVGIRIACAYSCAEGMLGQNEQREITQMLDDFGFPKRVPSGLYAKEFVDIMELDKKNLAAKIRLVLLKSIGEAVVSNGYSKHYLYQRMQTLLAQ